MITIPKFRTASKQNIRTFALPSENQTYTFKMQYAYDSYNRIQTMTYPDGEVVSYEYNRGGMLNKVYGSVTRNLWEMVEPLRVQGGLGEPDGVTGGGGDAPLVPPVGPTDPQTITYRYPYIDSIIYNIFELKDSVIYGNGTRVRYEYDSLQRLSRLRSYTASGAGMQDISYTYDSAGNITDIANSAVTLPNGLGGSYYSHYDYDPLYRLTGAYGDWNNNQLSYNLGMQYYGNGKIWSKQLYADVLDQGNVTVRNYNNRYYYGSSTSNTVTGVYDQTGHVWQSFSWDWAGNMVYHQDANGCGRTLCWDEENRLMSFSDCENAGFYQYDAGGERTYKLTSDYVSQNIGGHWHTYQVLDNPTLYTSPYMVATPKGYTKHYYAESERVASRIGGGLDSVDMFIQNFEEFVDKPTVEISPLWTDEYHKEPFDEKRDHNLDHLYSAMECADNVPTVLFECLTILYKYSQHPHHEYEPDCYWYHPDHLGSSSWITFSDGKAVQHLHYLPWGEDFVDQRTSSWSALHTFSAKERDVETGLSYFGARYYSSDLSIWLSVDPMSDKYPSLSPYVYCANNPVKLVDPNGEEIDVSAIYQKNDDGSFKYKSVVKAFEFFAKTKIGQNFLSKYAKKGQTIAGHTYESDGYYHKKGKDISFISNDDDLQASGASGTTESNIKDGRMKTVINLSNTHESSGGAGNVLEALCHEFFIHAYQDAKDYFDDKKLNNSQLNQYCKQFINSYSISSIQHRQDASFNNMMSNYAMPILRAYYNGSSIYRKKLSDSEIRQRINNGLGGATIK